MKKEIEYPMLQRDPLPSNCPEHLKEWFYKVRSRDYTNVTTEEIVARVQERREWYRLCQIEKNKK